MMGPVLDPVTHPPGAAATLPECADGSSHVPPYGPLDVPPLDPTAVHLLGYSMGSIVALHAAALLPRLQLLDFVAHLFLLAIAPRGEGI